MTDRQYTLICDTAPRCWQFVVDVENVAISQYCKYFLTKRKAVELLKRIRQLDPDVKYRIVEITGYTPEQLKTMHRKKHQW